MPSWSDTNGDAEWPAGSRWVRGPMSPQDQVTQLFEEAREDVYRYLATLGLAPTQAQEATQEVFLRLYMALKKGEVIQNPRAWLFRVAHNFGINLRTREPAPHAFDTQLAPQLPDGRRSPELTLIEQERMKQLQQALETLSPQQRRCLYLRAEGLRYREIAKTLGLGVSTVNEFITRAVIRLRKALHE